MHDNVTNLPIAEKKKRTITLTNRSPIQIVEDDWPIIAKGQVGEEHVTGPDEGWEISIYVRRETCKYNKRTIIHARYNTNMGDDERYWQMTRVGRIITEYEAANDLWKYIQEVGEELRERINREPLRQYVTYAVDGCFASLPPEVL